MKKLNFNLNSLKLNKTRINGLQLILLHGGAVDSIGLCYSDSSETAACANKSACGGCGGGPGGSATCRPIMNDNSNESIEDLSNVDLEYNRSIKDAM